PLAIDAECLVRAQPRGDGLVRVTSDAFDSVVEVKADGTVHPAEVEPRWGRLVAGVIRTLADRGRAPAGIDAQVSSTLPLGRGLSSSAAFEVAVALALAEAAGLALAPSETALACREAEELATGVPCGIMDQLVSLCGRRDSALLVDCRSLGLEPVPLPAGVAALVVAPGVSRALEDPAYAGRRAECESIAARLGLASLRDATPEQVADEPRARHVVSENARVLALADAFRRGDIEAAG